MGTRGRSESISNTRSNTLSIPIFITLSKQEFDDACRNLAKAADCFQPDVLVGIATGGAYVAEAMQPHLSSEPALEIFRLSRPATAVKQRLGTDSVLSMLPRRVSYVLRWVEVSWRERFLRSSDQTTPAPAELQSKTQARVLAEAQRVLIVDDTVDSGRTLDAAIRTVRRQNELVEVATAALASTWRRPPVTPDFLLYPRALVRFHWSMDVRS